MFSLESDEMTALWPNDSLTFTFYLTFSYSMPNWTTFVKEVFWFGVSFWKWRNDCFVTKWQLNFYFLLYFVIIFQLWCTLQSDQIELSIFSVILQKWVVSDIFTMLNCKTVKHCENYLKKVFIINLKNIILKN